ncbi:MAG: helicase-associated domain-containing protein [Thermomicrobiales bacterium]|nr:helicase-associated domain-containing protein [Thermomicrobiales bacterium]
MRNLLGRLLQRSSSDLERIAAAWAVELSGHERHADVSFLYRTMTDIWAFRDVWERVSPVGKRLLQVLDVHDGAACPPDELAREAGIEREAAARELTVLYDCGLIAAEEASTDAARGERPVFLPRETGLMIERIEAEQATDTRWDAPLDQLLATVPYPELEEAATAWGARVIPAMHARGELVGLLQAQLSRPERVSRQISTLSQPARNIWARLKTAGGTVPLDELLAPADVPLQTRRRILRELAASLLVWHSYASDGSRLAVVPSAILNPPPVEQEPPPDLLVVDDGDVVEPEWLFPYAATWDVLTILRDVANAAPRWRALADGDPAILRRFRRRLWWADRETHDLPTGYVPFIVRTAALAGIVREDDGRAVLGEDAGGWRERSFAAASKRLVAAWLVAEDWVEGRERVDAMLYGASWPAFRERLITALGELDEGQWYDQERFIERLLKTHPDLLRQASVVSVGSVPRGGRVDGANAIQDRREQILTLVTGTTLETACVWLGIIERSTILQDRRAVLRLTPFGRWVAGKRVEPSAPSIGPAPMAVGASFQVLLYRPTPRRVWSLSAIAELQSLDRISTWGLTAEAFTGALAGGLVLAQVVAYLERQSGAPLPQNVGFTLAEWDRGYRRIWLRRAVLLVSEEGEEGEPVVAALKEAGLEPELLADGRIALIYDEPDAGERLYGAATRALRERGFAPLADPKSVPRKR